MFAAYIDINSPEVTMYTISAYSRRKGTANPPQTTSLIHHKVPNHNPYSFILKLSNKLKVVKIPLPAHPTPGFGPPASTHSTPLYPLKLFPLLYIYLVLYPYIVKYSINIFFPFLVKALWNHALDHTLFVELFFPFLQRAADKFEDSRFNQYPPLPIYSNLFHNSHLLFIFS